MVDKMNIHQGALPHVSTLNDMYFSILRVGYRLRFPVIFSGYQGSAIRGCFGMALRTISCSFPDLSQCQGCPKQSSCLYASIFEVWRAIDGTDELKYGQIPQPFIIEPATDQKQDYNAGDHFTFDLILIGSATNSISGIAYALSIMGELGIGRKKIAGALEMESILHLTNTGEFKTLAYGEAPFPIGMYLLKIPEIVNNATLEFSTPLRIKENKHHTSDKKKVPFSLLFTQLYNRIHSLNHWYCGASHIEIITTGIYGEEIHMDATELSWFDWKRFSNRQHESMKLGGWVGKVRYTGDIRHYIPYLILGEFLHAGKQTSFGLGKYFINYE